MREQGKETGLAFIVIKGGALGHVTTRWSRLMWFELPAGAKRQSYFFIILPPRETEAEVRVVRFENCLQSNINNGVKL